MYFDLTLFGSYELAIFVKIMLATLAGGLIGLEREKHGRPAGLRTHLLVCAGSCLMMLVSEAFFLKYGDMQATGVVRLDPGRVSAQIITGIGFLGAGVIIKEGFIVRGLTTAACLWMVAGIGMAFGMGMINIGLVGTFVALFSLIILKNWNPESPKIATYTCPSQQQRHLIFIQNLKLFFQIMTFGSQALSPIGTFRKIPLFTDLSSPDRKNQSAGT